MQGVFLVYSVYIETHSPARAFALRLLTSACATCIELDKDEYGDNVWVATTDNITGKEAEEELAVIGGDTELLESWALKVVEEASLSFSL